MAMDVAHRRLDRLVTRPPISAKARLVQLVWGYRVSQAIYVAARLGVADHLSSGPRDARQLARPCGADASTLGRLLRALVSIGVFRQLPDGRYAHNSLSRCLVHGHRSSIAAATMMWIEDHYEAWSELLHAIRKGGAAFPRTQGTDFYGFLQRDRRAAARFNAAISELTSQEARSARPSFDFTSARLVVDVGGGQGDLLSKILKATPQARGILFDVPRVIRAARAHLRDDPSAGRIRFASGDFFRSVPSGADAYLLRWVLHNWDDRDALRILRNCRRAMPPRGRLLVIEEAMPDEARPDWRHFSAALGDLNMLVLLGGHERTRTEYRRLLSRAGLSLNREVPGDGYSIFEASLAKVRRRRVPTGPTSALLRRHA